MTERAMEEIYGRLARLEDLTITHCKKLADLGSQLKCNEEKESPSRQYLEKCLADKNQRIAELKAELDSMNGVANTAANERNQCFRRIDELVDCIKTRDKLIEFLKVKSEVALHSITAHIGSRR